MPGVTIAAICAGQAHTCAIETDGGVMCWGDNGYGQLGIGSIENKNIPVSVELQSGVDENSKEATRLLFLFPAPCHSPRELEEES